LPSLFNFVSEYDSKKVQEYREELEVHWTRTACLYRSAG